MSGGKREPAPPEQARPWVLAPGPARSRDDRDIRLETVRRLLASAAARDRIAETLYAVLADGVSFGPRDLPRCGDQEWILGAMAVPLQNATRAALEALALELTVALERSPESLLERIAESRRWQELGWE